VDAIRAGLTTTDVARRLGSTPHPFDDPTERCAVLGREPYFGWLFRGAAFLGLLFCGQSQTEAELVVDFGPGGLVQAWELATREVPL